MASPITGGLLRRCPQGFRSNPSLHHQSLFSLLGKKTCLEPREETHSGGGLGAWAWQSSDLHQDLGGDESPPLPWGRVPTPDTSTRRTHFLRQPREKGPFPARDAHTAGSHPTSCHRSATQPSDKPNQHRRSRALGPSGKASPPCSPRDPPGSGCLSRPPARHALEDAHRRTQQIGHTCGLGAGGPTPSQYLTLGFAFRVRPQAQPGGSSPS